MIRIEADHPANNTKQPFQLFCKDDSLRTKGAIPVTLWNNIWYHCESGYGKPALGEPLPYIHDYDLPEEEEPPIRDDSSDDLEEPPIDPVDQQKIGRASCRERVSHDV